MQRFKNYMLPVAMIVGALERSWMAEAAFLMPWLLFFMLLFSFARIAPREVTFSRLHLLLLSIQLFGSLAVYAALRGWNPV
ncbi:MAG: transporter, partial [Rikenellaceae bacterium]|nr:transporter [Rikenellaceae bacterium]